VKWVDRVAAVNVDDPKNYYNVLRIQEDKEKVLWDSHNELIKFVNVGTGIGGGFFNTQELPVMKYHEAINEPDSNLWKAEVTREHQGMIDSGVFEHP
jgi:hypothetical protein